jgi:hypothetical protein
MPIVVVDALSLRLSLHIRCLPNKLNNAARQYYALCIFTFPSRRPFHHLPTGSQNTTLLTKMNNAARNIPLILIKVLKSSIAQLELREPLKEAPSLLNSLHEANAE